MKRLFLMVLLILLGSVLLIGCSKNDDVATEEPEELVDEQPVEEEEVFKNIYPLTGIPTNEEIDHRPIAVTINNIKQARPHTGLNDADIVYEVLSEGDITRLIAIYHSQQPERVGSVRSSRDYFIDLANGYNAFFVTFGESPKAKVMLQNNKIDHIQGIYPPDDKAFERAQDRNAPHNQYTSYEKVITVLEKKGYKMNGDVPTLPFEQVDDETLLESKTKVMISYSNSEKVLFEYDHVENQFLRYHGSQGEVPTRDQVTDEQVGVKNLFIVETSHKVLDSEGRLDVNLTSGGKALFIQNGVVEEVNWENIGGRILPVKNGKSLNFVPGQTWINIVPSLSSVSITEE